MFTKVKQLIKSAWWLGCNRSAKDEMCRQLWVSPFYVGSSHSWAPVSCCRPSASSLLDRFLGDAFWVITWPYSSPIPSTITVSLLVPYVFWTVCFGSRKFASGAFILLLNCGLACETGAGLPCLALPSPPPFLFLLLLSPFSWPFFPSNPPYRFLFVFLFII